MAQDKRDNKFILSEEKARAKVLEGAKASYKFVTTTFGPRGKNVLVEKPFGRPMLTRDGVTASREIYFSDRAKNMGAQAVNEASENTNRIAGDGTTATVALAYHLLRNGVQAIASGIHPMVVRDMYQQDVATLLENLEAIGRPVEDGELKYVAGISAGSEPLGEMIAEAIEKVGSDGGIIAEKAPIEEVECEYVNGYYLQTGFQAINKGKKELAEPLVIVSIRRITSVSEVVEILNKAATIKGVQPGSIPRFLFVGNIEDAAYNHICALINSNVIDAVIVKSPPMYGDMGKSLLEDVALYAGCVPITESTSLQGLSTQHIGMVDKVTASKTDATLFAPSDTELVQDRITEIKDQIASETVDAILEKLKDRVAKLEGKIALFKIGAPTDTAKEELEFRVEDSINATRAAAQHGVVPGGGSTWVTLSKSNITPAYRDALESVFKQLVTNAGMSGEVALQAALSAPEGHGYNLRDKNPQITDLVSAHVLDPKLVVEQVLKNATDVAGSLLTTGAAAIFEDREVK